MSVSKESSGTPSLWFLGIIAVLFVGIMYRLALRRRQQPPELPGTFGDSPGGPRAELERLLTEIQDLSREHIARLDTKIRMLNQLLLECDQKKRELESLLGQAPAGAGVPRPEPPPVSRPSNPLHDQVYSLQDSGKDLNDICSATGLEKGEVELILGLRKMT